MYNQSRVHEIFLEYSVSTYVHMLYILEKYDIYIYLNTLTHTHVRTCAHEVCIRNL